MMQYTLSAAWVIECEPEEIEGACDEPLHKAIVNHLVATTHVLRAEYPERRFRCIVADMIVSSPEVEIAPVPVDGAVER